MTKSKSMPMMISLPKKIRDQLRIMAAERNMNNPDHVTSAATIAKELILEGIERVDRIRSALDSSDR